MYVIGGKLKGRKLANCKTGSIRPAMAIVRKSIFDTLQDFVCNADVLDLCAGSGSLGIESLSRGARSLTLVDSDKNSIKLIEKNLQLCNLNATTVLATARRAIKILSKRRQKFKIVFFDPPYGQSDFIGRVLEDLVQSTIVAKKGIIFIEHEAKAVFKVPENLKLLKEKKFGNTIITILLNE